MPLFLFSEGGVGNLFGEDDAGFETGDDAAVEFDGADEETSVATDGGGIANVYFGYQAPNAEDFFRCAE